ncbi:MAG: glycosyltransferase [Methylococcaceae bacterium]|nr:glycosyltransferase [Methylococcaceae bacterium]
MDLIYTVPSNWMLSRAQQSLILKDSDVRLLPNPIDTDKFYRLSQSEIDQFRRSMEFSEDDIVLAFGAVGGKSSYLKGAHLLDEALEILSKNDDVCDKKVKLIDFGSKFQGESFTHGFRNISLGYISEQSTLALLYSSVDCVVVPSLVESFGQVAAEALACETPVISFNYSGLVDIVLDGETGLTAKPYSAQSLADKIKKFILLERTKRKKLGSNGRKHIVKNFSYPIIAKIYKDIIDDAIKLKNISKE